MSEIWMHPGWDYGLRKEAFEAVSRVIYNQNDTLMDLRTALLMARLGMLRGNIEGELQVHFELLPERTRRRVLFSMGLSDADARRILGEK